MSKVLWLLLFILALTAFGCTTDTGNYQPPSGPIGGGCGIQMPLEEQSGVASIAESISSEAL